MRKTKLLREMLASPKMVRAPGAYDCITAGLIEHAGFPAVYMTGSGTSLARGFPDFGLLTLTEMAANGASIAASVGVPVIADADNGYGNELNVTRTVTEYERGGVAGLHIEDQVMPKRCGHLEGKELVGTDEFIAKIRAAAAARKDPDFVIIGRTDARNVFGLDEAISRANSAIENGADVAFVEAAANLEEVAAIPKRVKGPCLFNMVVGGKTPDISLTELESFGYAITILPSLLMSTIIKSCDDVLQRVRSGDIPPRSSDFLSVSERFRRFGSERWEKLRTQHRE